MKAAIAEVGAIKMAEQTRRVRSERQKQQQTEKIKELGDFLSALEVTQSALDEENRILTSIFGEEGIITEETLSHMHVVLAFINENGNELGLDNLTYFPLDGALKAKATIEEMGFKFNTIVIESVAPNISL